MQKIEQALRLEQDLALSSTPHFTTKMSKLTASAVLVPIVVRDNGLQLLLTQRSEHMRHHAGQISFPGGRKDSTDIDLTHTALRETYEEVGIQSELISIIGQLPCQPTVSGFYIQPIVGLVDSQYQLVLCEDEVSEAFEVPLGFVLDKANRSHSIRNHQGIEYPLYSIPYQERNIWGATASIIVQLSDLLLKNS